MHRRTLLAAVAWLGAALTAILVGVVAVNLVGAGIVGTPGGVRSQSDIERALAAAPLDLPSSPAAFGPPSPARTPAAEPSARPPSSPASRPSSSSTGRPESSPSARPPVRREFRVGGGLVVAECAAGLARLVSWSPGPGYSIEEADPGPDDDVSVLFDGPDVDVELTVTCVRGAPQGELDEDD